MNRRIEFSALMLAFIVSFILDKFVILAVRPLQNPLMDSIMGWITNLGSVIVVLLIVTSLFLWEEKKKKWILVLWLGVIVAAGICGLVKSIVGRPRMVIPTGAFPGSSFPSGHTAMAFATLPVLDKEFPKLKWFWIIFSGLVGFSRIYFGYHFLSDVIGGALLGYLIGHYFVIHEVARGYLGRFMKRIRWA